MVLQPPVVRDERVVVKFDRPFVERVNDVANRFFEGNRSLLIRTAVRELLERREAELGRSEEGAAA